MLGMHVMSSYIAEYERKTTSKPHEPLSLSVSVFSLFRVRSGKIY